METKWQFSSFSFLQEFVWLPEIQTFEARTCSITEHTSVHTPSSLENLRKSKQLCNLIRRRRRKIADGGVYLEIV